ncbi:hypothetical protein Ocin01_15710 [Orchesella cincta]|uniref:O-acyltransferase WSD1-like N-terminal domain-containing protein n=1 Tax=Orchesella cincta TaxID=48709 RepID=A0A1D2MDK9_ORCCI|nr:hypothetical protein Ocin01_15710 [Orchesella cincta]
MTFLTHLRSFLINSVAWTILVLLYGPPLFLLTAWRYLINFLATRLHSDYTVCSPNDTLLVHETPDKQPILTGGFCVCVEGKIDSDKLKTLFDQLFLSQENFSMYENLYCDLVKWCGYLFKRQIIMGRLKLENHFQERSLAPAEDFKVVVASWFQEKFQKGLPLWQMMVLHGEKDYFLFKAHHALADGFSFVHILSKLTGVTSPPPGGEEEEDKQGKTFWEEVKILWSVPEVVGSFTLPNISFSSKFPESKPLSNFEMLPMACGTCDLVPVREIRRKLGHDIHFPAIIYGLQIGVMRQCLLNSKLVDVDAIPEHVLLSTSLPVLKGKSHPRNKLTNHWSGGYVRIPLKTASAKERILECNRSLELLMKREGTYITWKYLAFLLWLFPTWFHRIVDKLELVKLCKYRSSMSCIPQSCNVQYKLLGLPVEHIYHAPLMKDAFLTAVLLGCSSSHHNQVDFSLFGHPDWFPDQNAMNVVMSQYMKKELEVLASECEIQFERLNWRASS